MGVVKVSLATREMCLAVYNQLKSIGLVTDTVGTPNSSLAIFSSQLVPTGYYLRIKAYTDNTNYSIAIEIGTVAGTTFTKTGSLASYFGDYGTARSNLILFYDVSAPWVLLYDTGGVNRFTYIGKLSTGKKISFCLSDNTSVVAAPLDLDAGLSLGGLWTLHRNASYNGYYLEQPLAIIDAGGAIIMDGSEPASVMGIKSISIALDSKVPLTELSGAALFGLQYIESTAAKSQLTTYLKIDIG